MGRGGRLPARAVRLAARLQELMAAGYVGAPAWRGRAAVLHAPPARAGARGAADRRARRAGAGAHRPDGARSGRAAPRSTPGSRTRRAGCSPTSCPPAATRSRCSGCWMWRPARRWTARSAAAATPPVAWLPGGEAFYYVRKLPPDQVPPGEEQFHRRVYLHTVGTPGRGGRADLRCGPGQDQLLRRLGQPGRPLAGGLGRPGHRAAQRPVARRPDRRPRWPRPRLRVVQEGVDARTGLHVGRDGRLYVFTDAGAPRGRLAVADPAEPGAGQLARPRPPRTRPRC